MTDLFSSIAKDSVLKLVKDKFIWPEEVVSIDPQVELRTRVNHICVSDDFKTHILSKANPILLDESRGKIFGLTEAANDHEIEAALAGEKYRFRFESELCARIVQMIRKQPIGEEGDLINDSHSNLFYIGDRAVGVTRQHEYQWWRLDTWVKSRDRRREGCRLFSRY